MVLFLIGCGGMASKYQDLIEKIPYAEFESFSYSRVTGVSSARIECSGAVLDGDAGIRLERVYINESAPGFSLDAEIKGYRREDAKDKKATMETYWVPGVNNLGRFGRWAFAEFTEVYQIESDFEAKVEAEFNKMIEQILHKKG